jgi:hypothetical protein
MRNKHNKLNKEEQTQEELYLDISNLADKNDYIWIKINYNMLLVVFIL